MQVAKYRLVCYIVWDFDIISGANSTAIQLNRILYIYLLKYTVLTIEYIKEISCFTDVKTIFIIYIKLNYKILYKKIFINLNIIEKL